jgi:hypothetical protein
MLNLILVRYDKQDQQEKAAFNERNPHTAQQQEPVARSPGGPTHIIVSRRYALFFITTFPNIYNLLQYILHFNKLLILQQ